jgi:hypothetical protein
VTGRANFRSGERVRGFAIHILDGGATGTVDLAAIPRRLEAQLADIRRITLQEPK